MLYSVLKLQQDELSRLKNEVLDDIEEIKSLQIEDDEADSVESKRDTLTKRAHQSILRMDDLLNVLEITISQFAARNADRELLWEKHSLQKQTVHTLKEKLRNSQVQAYEQESERIHSQIVKEYVKKWDDEKRDPREELFAGRSAQSGEPEDRPIEEQVLTQNKNITNSLKLTKQFMTMSVMQSELQIETFDQLSKDLSKFNDKLTDLESVLNKSRQIVKFIEKQDKKDRRRIYLSIGFLILCFAWVIWHRILKVPVKMLTWTLLKLLGVSSWFSAKKDSSELVSAYTSLAWTPTTSTAISSSVEHEIKNIVSSVTDVPVQEDILETSAALPIDSNDIEPIEDEKETDQYTQTESTRTIPGHNELEESTFDPEPTPEVFSEDVRDDDEAHHTENEKLEITSLLSIIESIETDSYTIVGGSPVQHDAPQPEGQTVEKVEEVEIDEKAHEAETVVVPPKVHEATVVDDAVTLDEAETIDNTAGDLVLEEETTYDEAGGEVHDEL